MNFDLGKWLFPKLPPDLQRRQMGVVYMTAAMCVVVGMTVAIVIRKVYAGHGH